MPARVAQHPYRYAVAAAQTALNDAGVRLLPLWRTLAGFTRGLDGVRAARARGRAGEATLDRLVARLGWMRADLPKTDGWAGSPEFLQALADEVFAHRPRVIVEFGSGISTLVLARAAGLAGGGHVLSFDHNPGFAEVTRRRLQERGLTAHVRAVELESSERWGYPGEWYAADPLPPAIDLAVIDGPPAWFNAGTRGGAGPAVFPHLAPGGVVLLDDAARPGERDNARAWRAQFPDMRFEELSVGKGILRGVRAA